MASCLPMACLTSLERYWTELPNHLLGLIAERLSLVDYLRFGTVCTCWASVVAADVGYGRRLYLPQGPQSPWLMLPGEDGEFSDTCTFFSLPDKKSYKITVPELHGKWWVGSMEGWVVTLDELSEIRLLNPLTRAQIQLPPIAPSSDVTIIHDSEGDRYIINGSAPYSAHQFRSLYVRKVVLSSSPAHGGYTALAIIGIHQRLAFTRSGEERWSLLEKICVFEDVIYHKGKFYCLDALLGVRVLDPSKPSLKMTIFYEDVKPTKPPWFPDIRYLVESSGDLLMVWRSFRWYDCNSPEETYTTSRVRVFKFDLRVGKWTPMSSLDDRCLFFGNSRSTSLSARDIPGLMHNCIHFTDTFWDVFYQDKDMRRDVGVFNLENGSFKPYHSTNSQIRWPAAMWFVPNLL